MFQAPPDGLAFESAPLKSGMFYWLEFSALFSRWLGGAEDLRQASKFSDARKRRSFSGEGADGSTCRRHLPEGCRISPATYCKWKKWEERHAAARRCGG